MLPSLLSVTWGCIFRGNFQYLPLLFRLKNPLFLVLHKILNKMVAIPASKCQKKGKKVKIFATFSWIINEMPCKTTKKSPFGRLFCGLTRHLKNISPFCSMGLQFSSIKLINYSWKRCKNFHFFFFLLTFGGWDWNHSVQNFMENNSIKNFEAWKAEESAENCL